MDLGAYIKELAERHITDTQFIIEVIASVKKIPNKLTVILDGDSGVTIDDCAKLSRALSVEMDNQGIIKDPYMLEVSTPGLDHPLVLKRQYYKNKGRKVRVKLVDKTVEGKLVSVTDETITVGQEMGKGKKKEVKEVNIPFTEIDKTFVLVSF